MQDKPKDSIVDLPAEAEISCAFPWRIRALVLTSWLEQEASQEWVSVIVNKETKPSTVSDA